MNYNIFTSQFEIFINKAEDEKKVEVWCIDKKKKVAYLLYRKHGERY